jgi:hypothetical protein
MLVIAGDQPNQCFQGSCLRAVEGKSTVVNHPSHFPHIFKLLVDSCFSSITEEVKKRKDQDFWVGEEIISGSSLLLGLPWRFEVA